MFFAINADNEFESFRLKTDGTWAECPDSATLLEDDFRTDQRQVILDLQTSDRQIIPNDLPYVVKPGMGFEFGNLNQLHYSVYCFRTVFPTNPTQPQLEHTLLNGDDNLNNTLILGIDGLFRLVRPGQIFHADPEIVLQFSGFRAGRGYVGPGIQDSQFQTEMMEYFRTAMHVWRNHIRYREVHYQTDELQNDNLNDLLDIYDELTQLQQNFQPL